MDSQPPRPVMRRLAREQRAGPSNAEALLWTILRDRRISAKFRRQMPIGRYIADFICLERRLIVEVDGPHHADVKQKQKDHAREIWLRANALRVLRLTADEVIGSPELATQKVIAALQMPVPKRFVG
ncbi:MAG: endonuclease domain-containing protein [Beijerinckiaceae bacterium]